MGFTSLPSCAHGASASGGSSENTFRSARKRFSRKVNVNTATTDITKLDAVVDVPAKFQRKCEEDTEGVLSEQKAERKATSLSEPCPVFGLSACSEVLGEKAKENGESTVEQEKMTNKSVQLGHMSVLQESHCSRVSVQQPVYDDDDEIVRKAREEDRVDVVFPGCVTQDGCYRFVCELLKCVLYQRQQLPMTYDQIVSFQKQQLAATQLEEGVARKSIKSSGDWSWQRCQRTLREMDEVLGQLEVLFSLSHVPRVLFVLGGSGILPTECYEINMEALVQSGSDRSLSTSQCLRKMFRTLFVADFLSDVKPVRLVGTTVMALAHRDCGIDWFKPKVDFQVPKRWKRRVILLASGASESSQVKADTRDPEDYIWFQTPVTIKGFK